MRSILKIRGMLFATTAVAALAAGGAAPAVAGDTDALLSLLASKGVISSSEAHSITSAPPAEQSDRLVAILRKKGVLADSDVKTLKTKQAAASASNAGGGSAAASLPPSVSAARATAPAGSTPMARKAAPFEIGGIEITPVGHFAATGIARSLNTGNSTATSFGAIPFNNTIQGNLTDTRLTAQNTLLGLRAHGALAGMDITGYFEGDFNGNSATNVFVNSNSHTFRMRLAYADINTSQFEASFGQMYSWLTPNRVGLGPDPQDVFLTNNIDQNFQVGLPWARQAGARIAWHATPQFSVGVGVENPQQYVGAGEVTYPSVFNAQLASQFDNGSVPGAPNLSPDVVAKAAFDSDLWHGTRLHLEAGGMWRHFRAVNLPTAGPSWAWHGTDGWAANVGANLEFFKTFTLVGNAFWSNGGGRYLGGLGPDVVALPTGSLGAFDIALSTVRSHGYLAGFEWRVLPPTVLSAYWGQAFFDRNYALDVTYFNPGNPSAQQYVGFGYPGSINPYIGGSSNTNNKNIQQWTLDLKHTFWADPRYGAVQGLAQYSYLKRDPWFVPAGAPPEAHSHLFFTELRYQLPGN